ncbi:MAG TPA: BamA/TamA family outer membrane protein [Thermoanaerobaculia bacterium]|nr:BamA/TamA family outer membrane protein [Thermoanaerobaculia bacterium]
MRRRNENARAGHRHGRWWTAAAVLAVALAVAVAPTARAQTEPGAEEPPLFLLEEIRVENAKLARPEVVLAEARLVAGREYGEAELRMALERIVRLPLVLAAEPRLEKGSERGRYVLVIELEEANAWFFNVDLHWEHWQPDVQLATFSSTNWVDTGSVLIGYRRPIGRRGVGFVALSGEEGTFNLGYTQYDVGRRGILISTSLSFGECWAFTGRSSGPGDGGGDEGCQTQVFDLGLDPTLAAWALDERVARARLQVGVPLTGHHSLRLLASVRNGNGGRRGVTFRPQGRVFGESLTVSDRSDAELSAAWVYDSTDDPIFPTRGLRADAGVEAASLEATLDDSHPFFDSADPVTFSTNYDSKSLAVSAGAAWFHTRGENTFGLRGRATVGRSDFDGVPTAALVEFQGGTVREREILSGSADSWSAVVGVTHSRPLWQRRQPGSWRELRWESFAEYTHQGTSPDFGVAANPLHGYRLGTALRLRTNWGLFSLRFDYLDYGGSDLGGSDVGR